MFFTIPATLDQVKNLQSELASHGTSCSQDATGKYLISGHGISANATYDGNVLSVNILHKPFYVSIDMIQNGIKDALK
jgi:hypothetical protein